MSNFKSKSKKRTFDFKLNKQANIYEKAIKRKHRNLTPFFAQNLQNKEFAYTTWYFLQRCETHNVNKNVFLNALRLAKNERESIRLERREILDVLLPTLITYCDFSPSSEYLFEVRANVEHIAKMCNQAYESWSNSAHRGRVRYDTILNAIKMLEDAELITVARKYDRSGRKYMPMRIFLNVEFFLMFNITETQLRKLIVNFHKYQFINNKINKTFKNYEKHLFKLEQKGVAELNYSLKNMLIKMRKDFLGSKIIAFVSQKKPQNYQELNIESDIFKPCFRSFNDCNNTEEVKKLRERILIKQELREKARLKAANDIAYRKAKDLHYLEDLRHYQ